jgi:hypothetical protein
VVVSIRPSKCCGLEVLSIKSGGAVLYQHKQWAFKVSWSSASKWRHLGPSFQWNGDTNRDVGWDWAVERKNGDRRCEVLNLGNSVSGEYWASKEFLEWSVSNSRRWRASFLNSHVTIDSVFRIFNSPSKSSQLSTFKTIGEFDSIHSRHSSTCIFQSSRSLT